MGRVRRYWVVRLLRVRSAKTRCTCSSVRFMTCATSGTEAIRLAQEETYDAVVLDLAMPGLDGLETLRRLRAMQPELQVMILSGRATVKTAVEAIQLGAIDIFEKPTEVESLFYHASLMKKLLGEAD